MFLLITHVLMHAICRCRNNFAHRLLHLHLRSYSSCAAGTVYEFGTPDFIPASTRKAGSRAVIIIDVHKVGTVRSSKFLPDKYPLKDLHFTIPVLRLRRPIVQI